MKVIIGLGNPGNEFNNTPHNIGFNVIDLCVNFFNISSFENKFCSHVFKTIINNEIILFVKPQTYMNNSGESIKQIVDFFKIDFKNVIIIYDDFDIKIGKFKIKEFGSAGTHNGVKNIVLNMQTNCFKRIRIGTKPNNIVDIKTYVLSQINKQDQIILNNICNIVMNVVIDYINNMQFDKIMQKYNFLYKNTIIANSLNNK